MFLPLLVALALPQAKPTPQGEAILQRIIAVREMPAEQRAPALAKIAESIAAQTRGSERVTLASLLVGSSSEGDLGNGTLQLAADALADALKKAPAPPEHEEPAFPYVQLALLERYEDVRVKLSDPELERALKAVDATRAIREHADFELKDLDGRTWKRTDLKGKVVLVNFWATWCAPCRREMPDLQALYDRFRAKGLVVLAVSDESPEKVRGYAKASKWTFPILLDAGGLVGKRYRLESIPKTFVYDREGALVATGIDMRTRRQFLEMLAKAGLSTP